LTCISNYFGPTIYSALGYTVSPRVSDGLKSGAESAQGHTTLMINGLQSAWGLVVTFIFISFVGQWFVFHQHSVSADTPIRS
jgi:hypothetical protein